MDFNSLRDALWPIVVRCITAFHNGRSHIAARVSAPDLLLQALFLESRHRDFPEEWYRKHQTILV